MAKHASAEAPSLYRLVVPPDGGWSLTPIENMLRGLRNASESFSLEIYGRAGVTHYLVRSFSGSRLQGLVQAYYPQSRAEIVESRPDGSHGDWLRMAEDEDAVVMPLWLARPMFMPLKTYTDHDLRESESDPLAGVIGQVSSVGRWAEGSARDRIGVRLLLHPAPENWGRSWQRRIQARRDGDDKANANSVGGREQAAATTGGLALLGLVAFGGLAYYNWELWQAGEILKLAGLDLGVALTGGLGIGLYNRFGGLRARQYLDEQLVEDKLKSLGFYAEAQLIRIYSGGDTDRDGAVESLERFLDVMRQFDNPAGNSWRRGAFREVSGADLYHRYGDEGLAAPWQVLEWYNRSRARRTLLSAREVSTLWHMPLGASEMGSIERGTSTVLSPYLEGLDKDGPLVGYTDAQIPVHIPDSALAKHTLFLGRTGTGKSTMIKQVIYHKMLAMARGENVGAIVVIDPHADLVTDLLQVVPISISRKIRLIDLGDEHRIPAINLMDPALFPDRDRCVDTIIQTLKGVSDTWGGRLQTILDNGLKAIHEFNAHADTPRSSMLTLLDLNRLLEDGKVVGVGKDARAEQTAFQQHVLSRVSDGHVRAWFRQFMNWPRDTRAEALGPVVSRIGGYAGNSRAKVVLGQRESTVVFSDVLREGLVVLVRLASGTVGKEPAALMGGTIVSLLDSALREQEKLPTNQRSKCLLVADEFQTITGTDWEGMLAEVRKYGCALMLATQSLEVLDKPERKLKDGIMSNTACLIAYQLSAKDAELVSHQMGRDRLTDSDLVNLDPYCAYVRITTATKALPVFSLRTLPPPEIEHGTGEAVEAVRRDMYWYTTDRAEALETINREALESAMGGDEKIGVSGNAVVAEGSSGAGSARGGSNPFSRVMKGSSASAKDDPLARIDAQAVESSEFSQDVLRRLMSVADTDPALQAIVRIRFAGQVKRHYRDRARELSVKEEQVNAAVAERDAQIAALQAQLASLQAGSDASVAVADPPVSGASDGSRADADGIETLDSFLDMDALKIDADVDNITSARSERRRREGAADSPPTRSDIQPPPRRRSQGS